MRPTLFLPILAALLVNGLLGPIHATADNLKPAFVVANTLPPDDYLSLRTAPSSNAGRRIATMRNGTEVEVLQRNADGWWLVRVKRTGDTGWALSGKGQKQWIIAVRPDDDQDPQAETDKTCIGILTANRTQSSAITADDGSRLIRSDNINESCIFEANSPVGFQIVKTCKMGFSCEVNARVNDDQSDVFIIKKVYSVRGQ